MSQDDHNRVIVDIYCLHTKFGEGYVFTGVCLSTGRGVGYYKDHWIGRIVRYPLHPRHGTWISYQLLLLTSAATKTRTVGKSALRILLECSLVRIVCMGAPLRNGIV